MAMHVQKRNEGFTARLHGLKQPPNRLGINLINKIEREKFKPKTSTIHQGYFSFFSGLTSRFVTHSLSLLSHIFSCRLANQSPMLMIFQPRFSPLQTERLQNLGSSGSIWSQSNLLGWEGEQITHFYFEKFGWSFLNGIHDDSSPSNSSPTNSSHINSSPCTFVHIQIRSHVQYSSLTRYCLPL